MGGGRSGLYYRTQGAKSTGIPFMGGTFGATTVVSNGGTGFNSLNGIENVRGFSVNSGCSQYKKEVDVVAALIWRGDKFLICQRQKNKARGLLWEFVGGKVEKGETKEQALVRECKKELSIAVVPKDLIMEVRHEYSDVIVCLSVFNCTISNGEPQLLQHNALAWIIANEIDNYSFCPAEKQILEKIKSIKRSG